MLRKAAYCFDDELVADLSWEEPVRKQALCSRCKANSTPHRTGVCQACRTNRCVHCGKEVKQHRTRDFCSGCFQDVKAKRQNKGFMEDEL